MLRQAEDFVNSLPEKAHEKIVYNIGKVLNHQSNDAIFKKLEGHEIWEIRTRYRGNTYRLLCFFDKYTGGLIVATHGFMKKTEKTPLKEIELAEQIMRDYYLEHYPKR